MVAESASRLGLTVREIPATVDVVGEQKIREQGYRTASDVAQGAVGVTSGDNPAEPSAFSMRGYTNSQINVLYNGIKIGPAEHDVAHHGYGQPGERVIPERAVLADVRRGRQRRRDQLRDQAAAAGPERGGFFLRLAVVLPQPLRLRRQHQCWGSGLPFDISRSSLNGFVDDTNTKTLDISGQLNYRISDSLKVWGAIEYKEDKSKAYWGVPLVSTAFSGSHATTGIVSGNYVSNYNGTNLGAVTIDDRTSNTNYNVVDNNNKA